MLNIALYNTHHCDTTQFVVCFVVVVICQCYKSAFGMLIDYSHHGQSIEAAKNDMKSESQGGTECHPSRDKAYLCCHSPTAAYFACQSPNKVE